MPWMIDEGNCVRKQHPDGSPGALLKCFGEDKAAAENYLQALYANVKDSIVMFSMNITKASYDTFSSNPRHWRAVNSDTESDLYDEKMSLELFQDFTERINNNTPVPEEFKSVICEDSWCGGMPYISIAHYKAGGNGKNVPGRIDAIYVDGNRLKSRGTLDDSPLGRAVFESLCDDAIKRKSGDNSHQPVRISIGFLDLQHKHLPQPGGQEFMFTRSAPGQICPLCEQGIGGKIYLKGQLVHLALTRVPVNPRTEMVAEKSMDILTKKDDARSIIKELADELDEKSLADGTLVIKSDENGTLPQDDSDLFKACYDPNTDSYDQECLNRVLVANMVAMREQMKTVKSQTGDVVVDAEHKSGKVSSEKSGVEASMADEKVEKMQLGGESVPEKKFEYEGIDGDPGNNITSNPLPQKAEVEKEEKEEEKEEDEMEKSFAQLRSLVRSGAPIDEINQAFANVGTAVEKSYQPKPQTVDASNLAEIVKSAVESAVAPLKMEIAQLKAAGSVAKSAPVGQVPVPRSLTIKPQDMMAKAQSNQPVRKMSQIERLARQSTGAPLPPE